MDDRAKGAAKAHYGISKDSASNLDSDKPESRGTFIAYMDSHSGTAETHVPTESLAPPIAHGQAKSQSTSAKALNRWFADRQKQLSAPRLLDIRNEAMILSGGPINLTGNLIMVDEEGNTTYANNLTLCRCGSSNSKPTCDERHLDVEFFDAGRISEASDTLRSERPNKITVTMVKDGPIKFTGRVRIRNKLGQECIKQSGSLCRCGQSANKPFCDGSHEKTGFRSSR
jgi:CDGSH-type Zn-finger protein